MAVERSTAAPRVLFVPSFVDYRNRLLPDISSFELECDMALLTSMIQWLGPSLCLYALMHPCFYATRVHKAQKVDFCGNGVDKIGSVRADPARQVLCHVNSRRRGS